MNTLLVFSYVMVMALYAMAFANYGRHFVPEAVRDALAPGVIVVLALVNLVGPRLVERSEGVLNLVKLAILAVFIVAGLASPSLTPGASRPRALGRPRQRGRRRHAGLPQLRGFRADRQCLGPDHESGAHAADRLSMAAS